MCRPEFSASLWCGERGGQWGGTGGGSESCDQNHNSLSCLLPPSLQPCDTNSNKCSYNSLHCDPCVPACSLAPPAQPGHTNYCKYRQTTPFLMLILAIQTSAVFGYPPLPCWTIGSTTTGSRPSRRPSLQRAAGRCTFCSLLPGLAGLPSCQSW